MGRPSKQRRANQKNGKLAVRPKFKEKPPHWIERPIKALENLNRYCYFVREWDPGTTPLEHDTDCPEWLGQCHAARVRKRRVTWNLHGWPEEPAIDPMKRRFVGLRWQDARRRHLSWKSPHKTLCDIFTVQALVKARKLQEEVAQLWSEEGVPYVMIRDEAVWHDTYSCLGPLEKWDWALVESLSQVPTAGYGYDWYQAGPGCYYGPWATKGRKPPSVRSICEDFLPEPYSSVACAWFRTHEDADYCKWTWEPHF